MKQFHPSQCKKASVAIALAAIGFFSVATVAARNPFNSGIQDCVQKYVRNRVGIRVDSRALHACIRAVINGNSNSSSQGSFSSKASSASSRSSSSSMSSSSQSSASSLSSSRSSLSSSSVASTSSVSSAASSSSNTSSSVSSMSNSSLSSASSQSSLVSVNIGDSAFSPATVTIKKGTMVRWTNTTTNDDPRTVTRDAGVNNGPNSGILDKGETYTFTFNTVGSFPYHSGFADMHGTVTVTN